MKILIGGDTVPTATNNHLFIEGKTNDIVGNDIMNIIHDSDFFLVNLETPLTNSNYRIKKSGPCLCAETATVKGLKDMGVSIVSLANNHIFDAGKDGLVDTLETLDIVGISHLGAGLGEKQIKKPLIVAKDGIRVGIYSCCEHEFSVSDDYEAGANPIDCLTSFDEVKDLKEKVNHVIVLYHGGREQYRYPMPFQQRVMKKFVESGASIVIAQHSHCIGCEERYGHGIMVYGQGNFIFDRIHNEYWDTGLLLQIEFGLDSYTLSYIPIRNQGDGTIKKAEDDLANNIMREYIERSDKIALYPNIIKEEFDKLCTRNKVRYLRLLHGDSILDRIIYKFLGGKYFLRVYGNDKGKRTYAIMSCESHNEIIKSVLESIDV